MATLTRIDKNGTKYYTESKCPKCGGRGYIDCYDHVEAGRCFLCDGSGYHEHSWKEYTPEYQEKLNAKRLAKAIKEAPVRNAKLWASIGLADDGSAWIVSNKYAKGADMKPLGARWNPVLGWFFKTEHDGTFFMSADELGDYSEDGSWGFKSDISYIVDVKRVELLPKSNSEYVGEVGKKIDVVATFEREFTFTTNYTWSGETCYVLKFKVGDNTLVWKTSACKDLEIGKTYNVMGTVKEHKEYKGDKQTILTRCKLVAC